MKKILALALCALMLFALCACGTPAQTTDATVDNAADNTPVEKKTFRVAMECAYAPYNWAQDTDANGAVAIADTNMFAYGYDVIIAKKIAEANNWDLEIVKLDWDSLIPALQAGTVDAVIAGQSITADRLEQVDFSTPYYYATIVTLVKNDSAYASAKSVADLVLLRKGACLIKL